MPPDQPIARQMSPLAKIVDVARGVHVAHVRAHRVQRLLGGLEVFGRVAVGLPADEQQTVATTSEGASRSETPQSRNFDTIAGSNSMRQLSTGASGRRARMSATL